MNHHEEPTELPNRNASNTVSCNEESLEAGVRVLENSLDPHYFLSVRFCLKFWIEQESLQEVAKDERKRIGGQAGQAG